MRSTYVLLTCWLLIAATLVVAQDESAISSLLASSDTETENYPTTPSISIEKEIEIEAKDIIVNIGKVEVEISKDDHHSPPHSPHKPKPTYKPTHKPTDKPTHKPTDKPTWKPTDKPTHKPTNKPIKKSSGSVYDDATDPIQTDPSLLDEAASSDTSDSTEEITPGSDDSSSSSAEELGSDDLSDDDLGSLLFDDFAPSAEPSTDETVLGENSTAAAITVQGGEQFDERGVLILTGPQIFSVTFKIVKEKVITIKGSDLNVAGGNDLGVDGVQNRPLREAVTFIIRGRGFIPGGSLFPEISDMVDGTSRGGMFDFLEPRVFLGAIPLKVVRFTDTTILARFLDIEDQRSFEAGTFLARVKVLHVDLKQKDQKHGPQDGIGVMDDGSSTEIASVGGLVLPALGAIGGSIPSGPVLGVVGIDGKNKKDDGLSNSLLGLFSGLRFDTAVLAVQFSEKDAQKIRGSFNTLLLV